MPNTPKRRPFPDKFLETRLMLRLATVGIGKGMRDDVPLRFGAPPRGIMVRLPNSPDAPAQRSQSRYLDPGSFVAHRTFPSTAGLGNRKLFTTGEQADDSQANANEARFCQYLLG